MRAVMCGIVGMLQHLRQQLPVWYAPSLVACACKVCVAGLVRCWSFVRWRTAMSQQCDIAVLRTAAQYVHMDTDIDT